MEFWKRTTNDVSVYSKSCPLFVKLDSLVYNLVIMKKEILIICSLIVMAALFLAGTKKPEPKKVIDTQVITCNTSGLAKTYIGLMVKKGYQVQHIISQSVATSVNEGYRYYPASSDYRDLRGDFVIIFTKEIEVKN